MMRTNLQQRSRFSGYSATSARYLTCVAFMMLLLHAKATLAQPPVNKVDVLHYSYHISLNDTNNTIRGSAVVTLAMPLTASTIAIDLGNDMKVLDVWSEAEHRRLKYSHSGDLLNIFTGARDTKETTLRINYEGEPSNGLVISKNKFGQRTFFSDHWPNRAHYWLPCVDHPSEKATVEFIVTAPARYQVVSNGTQIEETNIDSQYKLTHWRERVSIPMKIMCLGVAEFAVKFEGNVDTVPVYSWLFPGDRTEGFKDYSQAINILPFFTKNIGAYPFSKLANIQSKTIFGGMENAGAIFYSEKLVNDAPRLEQVIAHEIAHQWFGDMATEADWSHVWLSEGFATYLEILYLEHRYGKAALDRELQGNRKKVISFSKKVLTPVVDTSAKDLMSLLNANTYEKGGWALHMLRRQVGDTFFWRGLKTYYTKFAGKTATTADFQDAMELVSGKNLDRFFKQWLYGSGHPVLRITQAFNKHSRQLSIAVTQMQDNTFEFPLKIKVTSGKQSITKQIDIKDQETVIQLPFNAAPSKLDIDPENDLLFEEDQ